MKPDETYVENHQSETYWKCDYIVYSLNLRKFRDNPVTQELLYKCRIPPGKFNHIFGLHICVPRKVKFQYYYNAFLKIYRFKSKDETLDTIPDNKTVYDMSPIDNLFTTEEECLKECDKFNNEPNYRSIDDNTLRRHLRNLQMYWDIMIRLAKKYQVI